MNKKKKIIIIITIIVFVLIIAGLGIFFYLKNKNVQTESPIEVLDTIKDYGYNLEDRDTELYKETFFKLKDLLNQDTINFEEYATYLSELFLIDFYTINNKMSKYDVGSTDFIYPKDQEKFLNKAMDTIYKLVEDNSTNTRKQVLPEVIKVDVLQIESTTYQKGDTPLEAYNVSATITYKEDLGYDENVLLTLAKEENKLYVVTLTNNEE